MSRAKEIDLEAVPPIKPAKIEGPLSQDQVLERMGEDFAEDWANRWPLIDMYVCLHECCERTVLGSQYCLQHHPDRAPPPYKLMAGGHIGEWVGPEDRYGYKRIDQIVAGTSWVKTIDGNSMNCRRENLLCLSPEDAAELARRKEELEAQAWKRLPELDL